MKAIRFILVSFFFPCFFARTRFRAFVDEIVSSGMNVAMKTLAFLFVVAAAVLMAGCLVEGRSGRRNADSPLPCLSTLDCPDSDECGDDWYCRPAEGCLACTSRSHAQIGCFHGVCHVAFCDNGWFDANGLYQDGCEYACVPTSGGVEACDGTDNDCDARTDEDFDFQRDPRHCGFCGHACPEPPHARALCHQASCLYACVEGFYDVDGDPENGCESPTCVPSAGGVEICDLVDNDCNGMVDDGIVKDQPDSCGPLCEFCVFENAAALCVEGVCRMGACMPDCQDLDRLPENGCEYCCAPTNGGVEICDGADNDCNGLVDDGIVCACPADMAMVENRFCIDRYEASRPDATAASPGTDSSRATSRPGVVPWSNSSLADAAAACAAAGKRLCTALEWETACRGSARTVYSYGNVYDPVACNGIDAFCNCGPGSACESQPACPFAHCYGTCGAAFHPVTTGTFSGCTNGYGVFDINGNLWERVEGGAGRGGAFNCLNSEALHRCDYVANWGTGPISNFGFRCCCTECP